MNAYTKTRPTEASPAADSIHGTITGPVVMIGMGSIGKGVLPLLERHIVFDRARLTVIDPDPTVRCWLADTGYTVLSKAVTPDNHMDLLSPLLDAPGAFCINLSVDTSSRDLAALCHARGALYIDTVTEPWAGFYFGEQSNGERTNYALREGMRALARENPGGPTAVSCCGANPGMVSWLAKEALLRLAADLGHDDTAPIDRDGWARLMRDLGVLGIHIAERDTQVSAQPRERGSFINTWSVDGFLSEGFQPAELGWGTHETWLPEDAHSHPQGCRAAIWLDRPGAQTRVRTWCPTYGPQYGYLVTHNEAISLADYFTLGATDAPDYRPTCLYAYHPCDDAVLSLHETFGSGRLQDKRVILQADDIIEGADELGVLLYGHGRNALWYGSRLTNVEARQLAPHQNATALQVSSAVLAAIVWALENPRAGIVEAEEMDHARCLEIQRPYLGPVEAHYTDWTPLDALPPNFRGGCDPDNPWSFRNVLAG
jgi:homospermidine synthase